ncbi:helix-turn-helix domain-containing protein [Peribacillus frigoritolerans]|uniref:helix-turn-helix domain-containing protein n=1 Tax=Peribacillus frigoritolerans TaxID=450367 RepID=UPI0035D0E583
MNIGNRLRKARERKGISQLEVSKRININNKTLSRYENGNSEPDYNSLKSLAELYEVGIAYFFSENKNEEYDLKELLKDKKVTWGEEDLNAEDKQRLIEIIDILVMHK